MLTTMTPKAERREPPLPPILVAQIYQLMPDYHNSAMQQMYILQYTFSTVTSTTCSLPHLLPLFQHGPATLTTRSEAKWHFLESLFSIQIHMKL
jgi:hypothetical protein